MKNDDNAINENVILLKIKNKADKNNWIIEIIKIKKISL